MIKLVQNLPDAAMKTSMSNKNADDGFQSKMKTVKKHAATKVLPDAKNLQNLQSGSSRISMFKNAVAPG